ncbi:MAG: hypothetical protein IJ106_11310 [Parasporobacterium sp.]|nr:hypothetical protein [Parasporobacterium sp.]
MRKRFWMLLPVMAISLALSGTVIAAEAVPAAAVVEEGSGFYGLSSFSGFDGMPYDPAVYVEDGMLAELTSPAVAAVSEGNYDNAVMEGAVIQSEEDEFSAVIINGSDYTIRDTSILLDSMSDGTRVNDFCGLGTAVLNTNGGTLVMENTDITTSGVGKTAVFSDNGANTILKNCVLVSNGGTLYPGYYSNASQNMMVAPPWVLGLDDTVANVRTTSMMGAYTTQTFVDSSVYSSGWGALSTDGDAWTDYSLMQHLIAVNTKAEVENSGYIAYVQADDMADFYGVDFHAGTYAIIMTGGEANFMSYTGGQEIDVVQYSETSEMDPRYMFEDPDYASIGGVPVQDSGDVVTSVVSEQTEEGTVIPSVVSSDAFGFMFHNNFGGGWNVLNILDGTQVTSENATFLVKKVNADITVDHAQITSNDGVLLQIIDNDDDYVGPDMGLEWGLDDPEIGRVIGSTNIEAMFAGEPCIFPTFSERLVEPAGWSYEWTEKDMTVTAASLNTTGDSGWLVNLNLSNTEVAGDIWNSSGYVTENGGSSLIVNLGENALLSGIISSGAFRHTIQNDESLYVADDQIDAGGYYEVLVGNAYAEANGTGPDWKNAGYLGHVDNTPYANGYNKVVVNLEDNALWTVTGTCLLDELYIGADASVIATQGTLTLSVDGKDTVLEPGQQYIGEIVLSIE